MSMNIRIRLRDSSEQLSYTFASRKLGLFYIAFHMLANHRHDIADKFIYEL